MSQYQDAMNLMIMRGELEDLERTARIAKNHMDYWAGIITSPFINLSVLGIPNYGSIYSESVRKAKSLRENIEWLESKLKTENNG